MSYIDDLINEEKPLPLFRHDLEMYRGPDDADGAPTFNLLDPVTARFYKISWAESLILQNISPGMRMEDLIKKIQEHSPLKIDAEDIKGFYIDALRQNLLAIQKPSEIIAKEAKLQKVSLFKWLIFHYLYIRIPLVNPDKFLKRTLPYVQPFLSWPAIALYLSGACTGFLLLLSHFDDYLHTFTYFFNAEGVVVYSAAIIAVKLVHEFSHAYTAKRMGIHVPTMGLAFIVLWPVLYTDVTDSWKLASRRQRIAISGAGIAAELLIAGLCTIGWVLSESGLAQSVFFVVSSVTWISTLIINLNPAVRFDGYYILCDLWGMDNLQLRSFAYTRWLFRKILLGMDAPCPEDDLSARDRFWLVVYTIYTWFYRLFLYVAIALFVYYQFTKALGIFLFILEIGIFIIWPIASEIYELNKLRSYLSANPRLFTSFAILTLIFLWFALPLPHTETFTAITAAKEEQVLYVPEESLVKAAFVKRGSLVQPGELLAQLVSPKLNEQIITKQIDELTVKKQIEDASHSETDRPYITEKEAELTSLGEELASLLAKRELLQLKANISGTVYDWDERIREGLPLTKDLVLGKIANTSAIKVLCYVPEELFDTIYVGQDATFILHSNHDKIPGKVTKINPSRTSRLAYPQLASTNSGDLPIAESYVERGARGQEHRANRYQGGEYSLINSVYEVTIALDPKVMDKLSPPLRFGLKGRVEVAGPWRSKLMEFLRYGTSIFWRESSL